MESTYLNQKIAVLRRGFHVVGLCFSGAGFVAFLVSQHYGRAALGEILFSMAALLAVPCFAVGLYWNNPTRHPAYRRLRKLYRTELRKALTQIDSQTRFGEKLRVKGFGCYVEVLITEDWLIFEGLSVVAIPFEKIAWIYEKSIRAQSTRISGIQMHLTDKSIVWVAMSGFGKKTPNEVIRVCGERRPKLLREHSRELERKWRYDSEAFIEAELEKRDDRKVA